MKKILFLISSLVAIVALAALPLACSHDEADEDGGKTAAPAEEVQSYVGFVKYGTLSKDSVFVKIIKAGGDISILIETGIPYLSYEFKDVNINNVSADTSNFRAQSETIDAGSDEKLVLTLNGVMYNNCQDVYLTVSGSEQELSETLYFATDKNLLAAGIDPSSNLVAGTPNKACLDALNGVWEGDAYCDGEKAGTMTFTTTCTEKGIVTVDLGACQFGQNMPEMNIVLNDMLFLDPVGAGEDPSFRLYGTSASYKLAGVNGTLGTVIEGSCNAGVLDLGLSLTLMKQEHTIAVKNAQPKK